MHFDTAAVFDKLKQMADEGQNVSGLLPGLAVYQLAQKLDIDYGIERSFSTKILLL